MEEKDAVRVRASASLPRWVPPLVFFGSAGIFWLVIALTQPSVRWGGLLMLTGAAMTWAAGKA